MRKNIAVLLGGCGTFDGSEIQESVLTLLSIKQCEVNYQCFSIDEPQHHVTDHNSKSVDNNTIRNMLIESARIARGDIKNISELLVDQYDALIIPGGFGVAHNFCDFAIKGKDFSVRSDIARICLEFTKAEKPVGFICIAPVMIAKIYCGFNVKMTIGNDTQVADIITSMGMKHVNTMVDEICIDEKYKIVSTSAYMLAENIAQVYDGIFKLVSAVVKLI